MPLIKAAVGVVNQTPMAWTTNKEHILLAIAEARKQNVSLLCLPELCISGYNCEDYFFSEDLAERSIEILLEIAEATSDIIVGLGLPMRFQNRLYNVACLLANRRIIGFYPKQTLANNGIHYEERWFQGWPSGLVQSVEIQGIKYPFGDLVFDVGEARIAFEICEDAWVSARPARQHYERGVDIILNPSVSHFAFRKYEVRERLVIESSRSFGCSYLYTNLLGNEAGQAIYDGDAMIASNGELLMSGPRFSYEDFFVRSAVIDTGLTRLNQVQNVSKIHPETNWKVVADFKFPSTEPAGLQRASLEPFERGGFLKEEEFARAVCLGLFDYLRKSRANGFTVSISGGADSCACTALAGLMLLLADESIGFEAIKKKLGHIKTIQSAKDLNELTSHLITTIYQATENSSNETLDSAKTLASSLGATFYQININDLVGEYTKLIEGQIGRKLSWKTDDVALQNIQARVRVPGLWLLANLNGQLLLATSNRSEVAVGYATMDGDTAGSISPIAGIDKTWLREWLIWLEKTGCEVKGKHIRLEGLSKVNSLQPTAELRPKDKKQTDEADLMPYTVLNRIEQLAIRDKKPPLTCFQNLKVEFAKEYKESELLAWTERFFTLWSRNQWKRERYAPSFHLDDHNLNPRTWCRFPILSGGFESELETLREFALGNKKTARKGKIGF